MGKWKGGDHHPKNLESIFTSFRALKLTHAHTQTKKVFILNVLNILQIYNFMTKLSFKCRF